MAVTAKLLESKGIQISANEFEESVRAAVEQLPSMGKIGRPENELTRADIAALKRGGFDTGETDFGQDDPFLQGKATYTTLVASALSVTSVATLLHVDRSRIRQRLEAHSLYGVKLGNEWRLPTFQFEEEREIPGISEVVRALARDLNPVSVYEWFMIPNVDLRVGKREISPRDWLCRGMAIEKVTALAADL